MNKLIIIGGGGMGRSVYNIAINSIGFQEFFIVKGFLDDNLMSLDGFSDYPPVLDTIDDYNIMPEDVFICSIGNVAQKKNAILRILKRNGVFVTLKHKNAIINSNSKVGTGCIIAPLAHVGADTKIGNHCLIQSFSTIGHDATIGDWSRIDTHATLVGGVKVGQEVTIHTGAIINHKVIVEDKSIVGAGSFVVRRVKKDTTVYGNPAKKL